jgi:hypothetical protein
MILNKEIPEYQKFEDVTVEQGQDRLVMFHCPKAPTLETLNEATQPFLISNSQRGICSPCGTSLNFITPVWYMEFNYSGNGEIGLVEEEYVTQLYSLQQQPK